MEEVGGKFKIEGKGEKCHFKVLLFYLCYDNVIDIAHTKHKASKMMQDHDIVVLAWGLSMRCNKRR